jgi:hypothetical protein
MSVVPDVDADEGPPTRIPLRHFVVGLAFLVVGVALGALAAVGVAPGRSALAHTHLLLVGWVCVTIMGAMTQFVPVWSGGTLHSRRLAVVQLWLVAAGVAGMAATLVAGRLALVPAAGGLLLAGLWTFTYNLSRTLATVPEPSATERHFALAVGFVALTAALGVALALDLAAPLLPAAGVGHASLLAAHATLAVFGVVLTTVYGALYQLAPMFTQTDLDGVAVPLQRFEGVAYPVGVLLLTTGRLVGAAGVGRVGGALVALGSVAVAVVVGRALLASRVERTPMLSRYAVVAATLAAWAALALPAWLADPLAPAARFGPPGVAHLLVGVVAFVVVGTLYHVVPFVVWLDAYGDLLGYEPVPMIDDLYDDRVAAIDFWCLLVGGGLVVADAAVGLPRVAVVVGGVVAVLGAVLFAGNVARVVCVHSGESVRQVVFGRRGSEAD